MSFFEQQIKFANKKLSLYKKVNMDTIRIEILNPKARKLLKNLADLKLIKISDSSDRKSEFKKLLDKLRTNSDNAPSVAPVYDPILIAANQAKKKVVSFVENEFKKKCEVLKCLAG